MLQSLTDVDVPGRQLLEFLGQTQSSPYGADSRYASDQEVTQSVSLNIPTSTARSVRSSSQSISSTAKVRVPGWLCR